MHLNNTYSLKALLQSDLDPELCKLMLHQIKSPLLQHSFQLTTDDEYNGGSFSLPHYEQEQKPRKCQHKRNKHQNGKQKCRNTDIRLQSLSMAQSNYQPSKRQYQSLPQPHPVQDQAAQKPTVKNSAQSKQFVSPLQYNESNNITIQKYHSRTIENGFMLDESRLTIEQKNVKENQVAKWCGEVFNFGHAYQNQIYFDAKDHVRKKIFKRKNSPTNAINRNTQRPTSPIGNPQPTIQYVTFEQSILKLRQISEEQVARFLQFLSKLFAIFGKIQHLKKILQENESKINKIMIQENPVDYQFRNVVVNKNRIVNRLKVNKLSEAFQKLIQPNNNGLFGLANALNIKQQERAVADFNKTLQLYSQIQEIIEDYVSRANSVNQLQKIYNLLYDRQINLMQSQQINMNEPPSPIMSIKSKKPNTEQKMKNPEVVRNTHQAQQRQSSLRQKLLFFLSCLKINPQYYQAYLPQLCYVWSQISVAGAYSPTSLEFYRINREKFINELCKNDIIVHDRAKGSIELNIEKKLTDMGFKRNVE